MEVWKEVPTCGGKSTFRYHGSVAEGTDIIWRDKTNKGGFSKPENFSGENYWKLLQHFAGKDVRIGSFMDPEERTLEYWLGYELNPAQWGLGTYICAILIHENYAERPERGWIRFKSAQ